jgi:hypothetical protein
MISFKAFSSKLRRSEKITNVSSNQLQKVKIIKNLSSTTASLAVVSDVSSSFEQA